MSDPRFKGYTDSLGSDDEAAQQEPKDFPVGFMPAVFDRVLSGWFVDAKKQVDATTIACNIDDQYDISAELTYTVQYLKYGGLKYNWRAEVPEKLLDDRVHRVRILAFEANGRGHCLSTPVTLSPLRVPAINAVVYPWRDVTLRPEDQKEDPLRILVLLDAKVRPEWEASYVALSSWRLENEKGPLSVTLDPSRGAIVLDVAEPLKSNTTLYLGPVELEPGLKCSDDEPIRLPGAQTDSICWCGTLTSKLYQTHGYWEGEHNAWAYEFHVRKLPPTGTQLSSWQTLLWWTSGLPRTRRHTSTVLSQNLGTWPGLGTVLTPSWGTIPIKRLTTTRYLLHAWIRGSRCHHPKLHRFQ
jgi:hypothetical protein